ncbi:hypothetical protein EYF80_050462 [Liparis tanakae]|uniref:Uncharacterized protein n=1 Tax=Liparis tanakae TaxID=230148 RepID=A0A4Z2FF50_9TELE|nr:hypothetical protein EYF80_050462 [Liparis tanakae]
MRRLHSTTNRDAESFEMPSGKPDPGLARPFPQLVCGRWRACLWTRTGQEESGVAAHGATCMRAEL